VTGDASEEPSARVVDLASQPAPLDVLGRSGALDESGPGEEASLGHPQRSKDRLCGECRELLTADSTYDLSEKEEAHVRVVHLAPWRVTESPPRDASQGRAHSIAVLGERCVGEEPCRMRERLSEGAYATITQLREIPLERRIEIDLAALREDDDARRCREWLRQRG
jgi:hypothetical protein